MGSSQQFSLRWNNYLRHITGAFDSLRTDEDLVDVTLSCEGKKIRAHKMLLSACSSYFRELFKENPCQHPIIIFKDVKYQDLEALVDFMYQGEVNVVQEQLTSFLNTAELLAVQGLTDGSSKDESGFDTGDKKTNKELDISLENDDKRFSTSSAVAVNAVHGSNTSIENGPCSPAVKKRKCSSLPVVGDNSIDKDDSNHSNDADSIEGMNVIPNVKVEQPDYYEHERVGQFNNTVKEKSVVSININNSINEEKKKLNDIYSSSEKIHHGNPLLDINQMMGVSGPSLDALPQEPLQGSYGARRSVGGDRPFSCSVCGLRYKYKTNLLAHKKSHTGETKCPICFKILSTRRRLQDHFRMIHGLELMT